MTRLIKTKSLDQGEVRVVENATVPEGWGRFMRGTEVAALIPRGSFPLPGKWDTLQLCPADFDLYAAWLKEENPEMVIIALD